MTMCIGVDLMGGDLPPHAIFEAILQFGLSLKEPVRFLVIVHPSLTASLRSRYLSQGSVQNLEIEFIEAPEIVEMEDSPLLALRRKKRSSLSIGVELVSERRIDAFLTTGNTGALVGFATRLLPLIAGLSRAALLVTLPTLMGRVIVLDVGAHVTAQPIHLLEYARLGLAFATSGLKIDHPRVGLLNIGSEQLKGTQAHKQGYQLLQEHFSSEIFMGNVEGREVFQGKVEVLVTDGFTGNVFLKTSEGASHFLLNYLQTHLAQLSHANGAELLAHFHAKFDYSENPGALLIGVDGLVIKCHGYSDAKALISALRGTLSLVKRGFLESLKLQVAL